MKKNLITWAVVGLLFILAGFLGYKSAQPKEFGQAISPNLNLGINTSSTVTSAAGNILAQRPQNQLQWCYNGASGIWIGVTTTKLVAGATGSGFYIPTSTAVNSVIPNFSDYTGDIYGVTVTGSTSTLVCTRF